MLFPLFSYPSHNDYKASYASSLLKGLLKPPSCFLPNPKMFRIFSSGLGPMRQTFSGTSTLGLNFTGLFSVFPRGSRKGSSRKPQISLSWSLNWLRQPNTCPYTPGGKPPCQPSITNIFFVFPFASILLFCYLHSAAAEAQEVPWSDRPKDAEKEETRSSSVPTMPEGFVPIDYAVHSLMQTIDVQASSIWCQQLILSDLPEELLIIRYGSTYLCCKALVDDMNWDQWWQGWNAYIPDSI